MWNLHCGWCHFMIEHILHWNILSAHSVPCRVKRIQSWKTFKMSEKQRMHSGWQRKGMARRRIFNISDTINCFKPFKCQAALFKLEIVSVSTFVVVVGCLHEFSFLYLCVTFTHPRTHTRTNFIYLHFMKSALFHLTFYKWLRVFSQHCCNWWAIFNGRCQHSTSRLQFWCCCCCCFLLTIILSATTKWI